MQTDAQLSPPARVAPTSYVYACMYACMYVCMRYV